MKSKTQPVRHPRANPNCDACAGRGWLICLRANAGEYPEYTGKRTVQRCDMCSVFRSDVEAAKAAHWVGVYARFKYPCVLLADLEEPVQLEPFAAWLYHPPIPTERHPQFLTDFDRGCFYCPDGKDKEGPRINLAKSLPKSLRLDVTGHVMSYIIDRLDELKAQMDKQSAGSFAAPGVSVVAWKCEYLMHLTDAWKCWAKGDRSYNSWRKRKGATMRKKFGVYV